MLNIALIGAGAIGRIHARNLGSCTGGRLAVICDAIPAAANALSAEHDARATTSLDDALGDEIDGVLIASSTASHGDVAKACVAAGKPFLCEKPLASDQATGLEIVNATREAGLIAGMAFNRRFHPQYAGIKSAVDAGKIGRLESILITSRTAAPPTLEFIKTSGGLFGEKGAHFYDLARYISGEHPVELFAMGSALINPRFADVGEVDVAMITMRLPSGALCQLDFSWRAAYGQDERLEAVGSLGMLQTRQAPVGAFERFTSAGQAHDGLLPTWFDRFEETYPFELDLFLDAIRTREQGRLPRLSDGLAAQQLADAARLSSQTGEPAKIAPLV